MYDKRTTDLTVEERLFIIEREQEISSERLNRVEDSIDRLAGSLDAKFEQTQTLITGLSGSMIEATAALKHLTVSVDDWKPLIGNMNDSYHQIQGIKKFIMWAGGVLVTVGTGVWVVTTYIIDHLAG